MWSSVSILEVGDTCRSPPEYCVDFRKFFCPPDTKEIKPTRSGVALSLHEWSKCVETIKSVNTAHPALATAQPCYLDDDHLN